MIHTEVTLEFNKIKDLLCSHALSEQAKSKLSQLVPFMDERECRNKMNETTEARQILNMAGTAPLSPMKEIGDILGICEKGFMLLPEQLENVSVFLTSCKRIKSYLKKTQSLQIGMSYYGESLCDLTSLQNEIDNSIQNAAVLSSASSKLRDLRRKVDNGSTQIKKKMDDLLRSKKSIFSDSYVSMRDGRYVVPVKKEYKSQINGTVVSISSTGGTYFMEPAAASKLQDELNLLKIEEENEVRKVLYTLTNLVALSSDEIKVNMEVMITLDIAFAKAKLSYDMQAIPVTVDTVSAIEIEQGRHPLLPAKTCVPLDFSIGKGRQGIIITGPNTGGKTVALKTVGLLSLMAQSGLHVPVKSGKFRMNNLVLCDIGDGQSISENLSTFSAHIRNVIEILKIANQDSLVLLDELGSGTDPAEGMGIAVAILEELKAKNCLFLATTHYPEVKEYALHTKGLINARMAFDRESLKPLYQLEIGEAGESCALYIAKSLGFPSHLLEIAHQEAYKDRLHGQTQIPAFDFETNDTTNHEEVTAAPKIQKAKPARKQNTQSELFEIGDSVTVLPEKEIGIVFSKADDMGQVGVQIKGKKSLISHKRLKLKVSASELYPPDYDFSILFDTVENRKARHQMDRKYSPEVSIVIDDVK